MVFRLSINGILFFGVATACFNINSDLDVFSVYFYMFAVCKMLHFLKYITSNLWWKYNLKSLMLENTMKFKFSSAVLV